MSWLSQIIEVLLSFFKKSHPSLPIPPPQLPEEDEPTLTEFPDLADDSIEDLPAILDLPEDDDDMPVTAAQKKVIDAVLSINETGKFPSAKAYSTVTILTDGAGISYGKHQSTDRSGSLDAIIFRYLDLGGPLSDRFRPFLPQLEENLSSKVDPKNPPEVIKSLMSLLSEAGSDPLMQKAQDEVFDENYWAPAVTRGQAMGLTTALAYLALYDTSIHSGPSRIDSLRKGFNERPPATGGDEKVWVAAFCTYRAKWLRSNSNPLVQRSADRVDALLKLAADGNWDLQTPFEYRFGLTIP